MLGFSPLASAPLGDDGVEIETGATLAPVSISTGAPSVGTTALSQEHSFSAIGISVGAPAVDAAALSQEHSFSAIDIATGAPAVDAAALSQGDASQNHAFTATNISSGSPDIGTPALSQEHALLSTDIATDAPSVGTPALAHVIDAAFSLEASASVSAGAIKVRNIGALINCAASATVSALRKRHVAIATEAAFLVNANAVADVILSADIAAINAAFATANRVQFSGASAASILGSSINAKKKWEQDSATAETWSDVASNSKIWQDAASTPEAWVDASP
jgi:hypothetical protein